MSSSEYNKAIFEVESIEAAKRIILTSEKGATTEERWVSETPWTADKIIEQCRVTDGDLLLDYGCGIGRVAKEILRRVNVSIIGVDISGAMLRNSLTYVDHPRFCAMPRDAFVALAAAGKIRVDHTYSIYVLQHVENPAQDIQAIGYATQDSMLLINNTNRVVPVKDPRNAMLPWKEDGFDVVAALRQYFPVEQAFDLDFGRITPLEVGLISATFRKHAY